MESITRKRKWRIMLAGAALLLTTMPLRAQHEHGGQGTPKQPMHAPQSQRPDHHEMHDDVVQLRGLQGADLERTFLTGMMDHHQSGIDMSKLAVQRARSPRLRQLAQKIMNGQNKEIAQMRTYLSKWYSIERTAKPDPRMQETMQRLQGLSGAEFDRAFVQEMGRHHEGAILMGQPVGERAPHRELRRFVTKMAKNQRQEQRDLRASIR